MISLEWLKLELSNFIHRLDLDLILALKKLVSGVPAVLTFQSSPDIVLKFKVVLKS